MKRLLFSLLFLGLASAPRAALADRLFKLEVKALPESFVAGAQLDLPLYLVENRAASEGSTFDGYPASGPPYTVNGPLALATVESEITCTQSTLLSFTPLAVFDSGTNNVIVHEHDMQFFIKSTEGLQVSVDNSGITGRTEIRIGTLSVQVGASIPQNDGLGNPEPDLVFAADFSSRSGGFVHNSSIYLGPSGSNNQGQLFLGGIVPAAYRVTAAPTPTPPPGAKGTYTLDNIKSYQSSQGIIYPNITCTGIAGVPCVGKAEFFVTKKSGKKTVKTVYGKCDVGQVVAPHGTYCIMNLTKAAKNLLKTAKKIKGTLQVTTTGITGASKLAVTVK